VREGNLKRHKMEESVQRKRERNKRKETEDETEIQKLREKGMAKS